MTNQASEYWNYGLDPNSQVRAENMWETKAGTTRDYQILQAYDGNGNRLTQFDNGVLTSYTYGDSNQILTAGSDTFTFDHFLNMKTKVSGGNTTTYNWDSESNLTSIDYPGTPNDDSHEYDGAGRRMRSKLNGAANWTHFVWDEVAGTLLGEYTFISSTFTITAENTWGHGLYSTNRASTKRYFHFDGSGNAIALTDTSEDITDTYGYTSSGTAVSSLDSGTSVNPFRWMGMSGAYDDGAMGSSGAIVVFQRECYNLSLGISLVALARVAVPSQIKINPIYGEHCGPQTQHGPPWSVDRMDECCRIHDECFEENGCTVWNQWYNGDCRGCNRELCECLGNVDCKRTSPWRVKQCEKLKPIFMAYACTFSSLEEATIGIE